MNLTDLYLPRRSWHIIFRLRRYFGFTMPERRWLVLNLKFTAPIYPQLRIAYADGFLTTNTFRFLSDLCWSAPDFHAEDCAVLANTLVDELRQK